MYGVLYAFKYVLASLLEDLHYSEQGVLNLRSSSQLCVDFMNSTKRPNSLTLAS